MDGAGEGGAQFGSVGKARDGGGDGRREFGYARDETEETDVVVQIQGDALLFERVAQGDHPEPVSSS